MRNKKHTAIALGAITIMMMVTSCMVQKESASAPSASTPKVASSASVQSIQDRDGNDMILPAKLERIISTAPSNTEILIGLGLGDKLIAVDRFSMGIEGVLPTLSPIDFDLPDAEALLALSPDIIIASGHNKKSGEDPLALLREAGVSVVYIPSSTSVQGICDDIQFIAQVCDKPEQGKIMADEFMKEIEEIRKKGRSITDKKQVYFEIAPAPDLYSFGQGTFLNEFIEIIGAENIFAGEQGWISPNAEVILGKNPDVILTNAGYVENAVKEIQKRDGWENIKAIKEGQVYLIDTNTSSRASQYSIQALKQIAQAVYPDVFR